jgi:hypothetical protein
LRRGALHHCRTHKRVHNREHIEHPQIVGLPAELAELLRRMPLAATEHIAARFGRAALVEDSESLLWMMEVLGPEVIEHLRERLEPGEASAAIDTVGLLTRIDIATKWLAQDLVQARQTCSPYCDSRDDTGCEPSREFAEIFRRC